MGGSFTSRGVRTGTAGIQRRPIRRSGPIPAGRRRPTAAEVTDAEPESAAGTWRIAPVVESAAAAADGCIRSAEAVAAATEPTEAVVWPAAQTTGSMG